MHDNVVICVVLVLSVAYNQTYFILLTAGDDGIVWSNSL